MFYRSNVVLVVRCGQCEHPAARDQGRAGAGAHHDGDRLLQRPGEDQHPHPPSHLPPQPHPL